MRNEIENILSRLKSQSLTFDREAEIEAARKAEEEEREAERYSRIIVKSQLPARYAVPHQNLTGDDWKARFRSIAGRLGNGIMVAFCGGRGTGKTQMAAELCHYTARKGRSCRYSTAMQFFLELRATFAKSSEKTELDVVEEFARPSLLIIDEAQERGESEWHDRMLTMLLDRRYAGMKDTVIISNQVVSEFAKSIGDSNASRIREVGAIVQFSGESYRKPVF